MVHMMGRLSDRFGGPGGSTERPPSDDAVERLADSVHREVDDLQHQLEGDLLLTGLFLDAGEVEEARRTLDDRAASLRAFEDRVERALTEATIEREAQEVVARAEQRLGRRWSGLGRSLAGVGTAVVAIGALVFSLIPSPATPRQVLAGRAEPSATPRAAEAPGGRTSSTAGPTEVRDPGGEETRAARATRRGLEMLRLLGHPSGLLLRLMTEPDELSLSDLLGLSRLRDRVAEAPLPAPPAPAEPLVADDPTVAESSEDPSPEPGEPSSEEPSEPTEEPSSEDPPPPDGGPQPEAPAAPSAPQPGVTGLT